MDWQNLISRLIQAGMTQRQISDACGCGQSTISDIATGKTAEPGATIALKLLSLIQRDAPAGEAR